MYFFLRKVFSNGSRANIFSHHHVFSMSNPTVVIDENTLLHSVILYIGYIVGDIISVLLIKRIRALDYKESEARCRVVCEAS